MDDRGTQIGRRELLALGLTGAAAAVVATVAEPGVAEAVIGSPAGGELAGAEVDLAIVWTFTESRSTLKVTGTVDGKPVDAKGNLYGRPATVTGSLAGENLDAILSMKDQVPDGAGYATTAHLTASVGDVAMALAGVFRLDSSYSWVHADITGSDRASKVEVKATPPSSGNNGSKATLSGTFATAPIAIKANVPLGSDGSVTGSVGGKNVDLRIRQDASNSDGGQLTGTFNGPAELLAIIIGAVAYFAI